MNERIKFLINRAGSQRKAAQLAGISPEQLGRYLKGTCQPTFAPIARLAQATGTSLDWVWSGEEERQGSEDLINHPPHYISQSGLESVDVIEAFGLGFHLGNVIKYVLRAGKKDDKVADLKKARWYLTRMIKKGGSGE